ncbi:FUSC family protein [Actinomycetospora termitidis]|uniref:FUSC family protein n=1 Tax=Actinomycetospora termitidis TaxID=3053470 RepID=A0ABT7M3A3_9PSEU|nr:FUSC family protein [Actinomycetospora sp. Odt1-22]MDL5154901.1 FUSC family protein [Actinomycetospora sp. Odt1-22]
MGARTTRALEALRTLFVTSDPGLARLRLASVAVASMALAAGLVAWGRATVATDEPVTVVLFAGVLAMISNLAVNEKTVPRQRATTALMALPALASTVTGTLLSPYRVVADVVFVAVMIAAVYVRRFGPRGFALGMAAFMPFFFTQFLQAKPPQVPALCVAVVIGLSSTLLLRGFLFAERPERTLRRLVDAFRARAHEMVLRVDEVLAEAQDGTASTPGPHEHEQVGDAVLERLYRARRRLNETALLVEDQLEHSAADRVWPGLENDLLALRVVDTELGLERLGVSVRRMVRGADAQRPTALALTALRTGVGHLARATDRQVGHRTILEELADARGAVAGLVADTSRGHERMQRAAFAVRRVADSVEYAQRDLPARPGEAMTQGIELPGVPRTTTANPVAVAAQAAPDGIGTGRPAGSDDGPGTDPSSGDPDRGLLLTTRQSIQVGVGTTIAITLGELLAPTRWYWAVIASFVVFANTASRGDLLSRGWGRVVGTIGGVAAGMGLAALTAGDRVVSLVLLFGCAFLALYLVRLSPGMLAFWITAVLALVYGLIGQFSVQTLVLRIEETLLGVLASVVAAFLVLPKGTREAFGEAVEAFVDAADGVLDAAVATIVGRGAGTPAALDGARDMDTALATLRARARPLMVNTPKRRGRSSHRRALRVFTIVDHYARSMTRTAADLGSDPTPGWAPTLEPALAAVRANLDGLRDVVVRGKRRSDGGQVLVHSAEDLVDRAEEQAARSQDPRRRNDALVVTRLLRRIDQAVVALAVDLGAARDPDAPEDGQSPSSRDRAGLVNTRSGS